MVLDFREDDAFGRLNDLPSWAPDYSVSRFGTPLAVGKPYTASGKDIFWPDDIEL